MLLVAFICRLSDAHVLFVPRIWRVKIAAALDLDKELEIAILLLTMINSGAENALSLVGLCWLENICSLSLAESAIYKGSS